nr:MAG: VRR-NUC domain [Bacteriophage sp.]
MEAKGITTKSKAIAELRKLIKKESYYQDKIKKTLQKKYPGDFVRKITQGAYSEAGIPDILFIRDGHYFGFEVKRPVVGVPSKIQLKTIEKIREAGGTAAIVVWPEQAIAEVEKYEKSKR